jgi:hypothetical protein
MRPSFETRTKKLVAAKHEARLNALLGPANRAALLAMLGQDRQRVLDRAIRPRQCGPKPSVARRAPRGTAALSPGRGAAG